MISLIHISFPYIRVHEMTYGLWFLDTFCALTRRGSLTAAAPSLSLQMSWEHVHFRHRWAISPEGEIIFMDLRGPVISP